MANSFISSHLEKFKHKFHFFLCEWQGFCTTFQLAWSKDILQRHPNFHPDVEIHHQAPSPDFLTGHSASRCLIGHSPSMPYAHFHQSINLSRRKGIPQKFQKFGSLSEATVALTGDTSPKPKGNMWQIMSVA